jgi:phosphatidate cytidylyltransferase
MSDGLKQRVTTALVLAPLAIAAVLLAPTALLAVLLAAAFLGGLWEWTRLVCLPSRTQRAAVLAVVAGLMLTLWFSGPSVLLLLSAVGAGLWLLIPLWLRRFDFASAQTARNRVLKTLIGALMIIAAWAALVLLHAQPLGAWWLLYALALIWVADIGAYFAGRAFGRRKLAPSISPGKTWAGVWGALAGTTIFAVVAGLAAFGLGGSAVAMLLGLSLVSVVFSIVGDLFESLIKRHSHCKDSGSLLPGHGGVLDRIDSILAAAPVFVAGKLMLGL